MEGICKKMSLLSKQYAGNVRGAHLKLFVDPDSVKQDTKSVSFKSNIYINESVHLFLLVKLIYYLIFYALKEIGRFRCHPAVCGAYSFTDAGKLPTIEFMQQDREHVLLKFKNDVVRLTTQYLQKLVRQS